MTNRIVLAGTVVVGLLLAYGVTAEDVPAARPPLRELLTQADANADGTVTFEELSAAAPDVSREGYDRLDRNKDGVITAEDRPPQGPEPEKPAPDFYERFRNADKDGDGKVTLEELKAIAPGMTQEKFDMLDRNKDGVITAADRPPQQRGKQGKPAPDLYQRFLKADKDSDGKVTLEEVKAVAPEMTQEKFDTLDRNKDGVITAEDRPPQRPGKPGEVAAPPARERFREADMDGDGKVTFEELKAAAPGITQEKFNTLDTDKDGALSAEERERQRPPSRRRTSGTAADAVESGCQPRPEGHV